MHLVSCSASVLPLAFYGLNLALAAWRIHRREPGWWSSSSCHAGASHRIEHLAVDRPLAAASGALGTSWKWTLSTPLSIWAWRGAPSIAHCPSKEECSQSECRHRRPFAAEKSWSSFPVPVRHPTYERHRQSFTACAEVCQQNGGSPGQCEVRCRSRDSVEGGWSRP